MKPHGSGEGDEMSAPRFVEPMAARLVTALPEGPEWLYEAKLDGYRALIIKDGPRVQVRSRNDKDMSRTYPSVTAGGRKLVADQAIVDGEVVAVDADGRPSFQALQHRGARPNHAIAFYAFDLLHLNGRSLMDEPLEHRRAALPDILEGTGLLLSIELPGTASEVAEVVRSLGLEGVVAKKRRSRYTPGERTSNWFKLKLDKQQEFVVGGYRPGAGGVDSLLVGYYEGRKLHFAGKVRAGFTPHLRREVAGQLFLAHHDRCPFDDLPSARESHWGGGVTAEQMREMQWVEPKLVAQIRFVEWTAEGHLRHAAFLGLRTDKRAQTITREP
jgi:bifunctional non-homologous end joining protein LigD